MDYLILFIVVSIFAGWAVGIGVCIAYWVIKFIFDVIMKAFFR